MDTTKNRDLKKLMDEILGIKMVIKNNYPELYEHLSETPLFLLYSKKEVPADFEAYLNSLKTQLKTFKNSKKKHDRS